MTARKSMFMVLRASAPELHRLVMVISKLLKTAVVGFAALVAASVATTVFAQELEWISSAGGVDLDRGEAIAATADGGSVVTGFFQYTVTFGAGETNETTLVSAGNYDIFVARYAADGRLLWARRAGGTSTDSGASIAATADGGSVVTGTFYGTATFGAGEVNETTLVSELSGLGNSTQDIFVARYAADGRLLWARRAGGESFEYSFGIATAVDGGSVITGYIHGPTTFGAGETNETTLVPQVTDNGPYVEDIFVAHYAADGELLWARRDGGGSGSNPVSARHSGNAVSASRDGGSVVTGVFSGTATFGAGEVGEITLVSTGTFNFFIARYSANGKLLWARQAGGTSNDTGTGIATTADGDSVVTGYFSGMVTFVVGEANETTLESDSSGIFIARYNSNGSLIWARRAVDDAVGPGIAATPDGGIVVTGSFSDTATFGVGEANETTLESDSSGIFIARYNSNGSLVWARRAAFISSGGNFARIYAHGIAAPADGGSVLAGTFSGTATFGAGETNERTVITKGQDDVFVAKFAGLELSPKEAVAQLISLVRAAGLPSGIEHSLAQKLRNALSSLDKGHDNAAIGALGAFINEVKAQSGKKIGASIVSDWSSKAERIIRELSDM